MKINKYTILIISILTFISWGFSLQVDEKPSSELKWHSFEEVLKLQEKNPKKVIIDVYTDWCGWCKKMDKNTYSDASIIKKLNEDYYFVKFNAEQKEDVQFRDKTLRYKEEYKSHELALSLLSGKMSYPSTAFLDEDMNMLTVVPGYLTPKDLSPILDYFGKNHYKKMNWEEYTSTKQ